VSDQPTHETIIRTPQELLKARITALPESAVFYALFSMLYSADPSDRERLAKALDEAEKWQRELAAVRGSRTA
jgi:hypothetical protein